MEGSVRRGICIVSLPQSINSGALVGGTLSECHSYDVKLNFISGIVRAHYNMTYLFILIPTSMGWTLWRGLHNILDIFYFWIAPAHLISVIETICILHFNISDCIEWNTSKPNNTCHKSHLYIIWHTTVNPWPKKRAARSARIFRELCYPRVNERCE